MKRLLIISIACFTVICGTFAKKKNEIFLFEEFQKGQIFFKDGRQYDDVDVNYSLLLNQFLFIDATDNTLKPLTGENVRLIQVKNRYFQISEKDNVREILQPDPLISIEYKGKLHDKGAKGAYGVRDKTSSVDELRSYFFSPGGFIQFNIDEERWTVSDIVKNYQITKGKKTKTFRNLNQFLKVYPKLQNQIEQYANECSIDFDNATQVVQLYNYAESL